jgi:glycosyltransferase 2 family protein
VKSRWYKLAGVLISALFLYLAVRKVDFADSVRILGTTQLGWLLVATLIYLSAFLVRALRWRRILRDQKALSLKETVVPVFLGYMANHLLPARAGEIYRAHVLGRRAHES